MRVTHCFIFSGTGQMLGPQVPDRRPGAPSGVLPPAP